MALALTRPIVFIGFMGAGKTTAARSLADALGTDAVDVDAAVEQRLGKPIEQVFAEDGEPAFRAAEEQVTLELLRLVDDGCCRSEAARSARERVREALEHHLVVWVDVDVDTAWRRCAGGSRPLARTARGSSTCTASASRSTPHSPT